jgi:vitamin B12 transporter
MIHCKSRIVFLLYFLFYGTENISLFAQKSDTLHSVNLQEVSVFGPALNAYTTGSRIQRLDSSVLKNYNSSSLTELLQTQLPLYFKNYGQNGLSSVAFRGTSAGHTNVLWNGFSVNSPTFGSTDFSVLPASGYSNVEIQYGNAGSVWGSGSMGGSVLLSSQPVFGKGLQASFQTETSRFGNQDFSVNPLKVNYFFNQGNARFSNKKLHLATGFWQHQAENNFPYRNTTAFGSPEVRQENAAFRQKGFTQEADWKFSERGFFSVKLWYTDTYRQAQPSMISANNGDFRIDDAFRLMLSGSYKTFLGETTLKTAFFRDALNWNGENSPVKSYQTQLLQEKSFSDKLSVKTGTEIQIFQADIVGNYNRSETRMSFFALTYWHPVEKLHLTFNLRQALVTDFRPPFTPHLGAGFYLYKSHFQSVMIKANVGKGYRVPTLHDRFWVGGGNPDIRPENSLGYEGGILHKVRVANWQFVSEATYYRNLIENWIQWTPSATQNIWSPRNLFSVKTEGLEISCNSTFSKKSTTIKFNLQYALNVAVYWKMEGTENNNKQLEYTPIHNFLASVQIDHKKWFGNAVFTFTDKRETFGYNAVMPSYMLTNMMIGKKIQLQKIPFQILLKCNNLFNTEYRTYGYYAMPGRSFGLSLRFQFNP